MAAATINTKTVTGRRVLAFQNVDDILADAEGLASAKGIHTLGNWSAGQLFAHIARVMSSAVDGTTHRAPWIFRQIGRYYMKGKFLKNGMTAGFKLPEKAQKEFYPSGAVPVEEGLQALKTAVNRFKTEKKLDASPFFGPMTEDEWTRLQCRHAELHFSFLKPDA